MRLSRITAIVAVACAAMTARADFLRELPQMSTVVAGYGSADSVQTRLAQLPMSPVEGLWQTSADGSLFAIERVGQTTDHAPRQLRLVMVRSDWRSIRPGTVFGHAVPTVKPGVYEARIYSNMGKTRGLNMPQKFTLTLDKEGRTVTFRRFKSPVKVNLFRLLPYLYRRVVTLQQSRPDDLDGAVKVYPATAGHTHTPIYL